MLLGMLLDLLLVARILIGQIEQKLHEGMLLVLVKELDHAHDLEKHKNSLEHQAIWFLFNRLYTRSSTIRISRSY